jgi:hypothetical protein
MFGYIRINRLELKGKDFDTYSHFYCGVCQDLKEGSGQISRLTLTYDMTFLAILLTALYEKAPSREVRRCGAKGGAKRLCYRNEFTAYAAKMNVLLAYHDLEDDWIDERRVKGLVQARALRGAYRKAAQEYSEKAKAIRRYLKELHATEESQSRDIDLASGQTGTLMKEIFTYRDDHWSKDLGEIGFYLGKFIYLRDAYEDVQKDREAHSYNPFMSMAEEADFDARAEEILRMMAASATRAFERLPIVRYLDILRNILYSGIWVRTQEKKRCGTGTESDPEADSL